MDTLNRETLLELIDFDPTIAVSIFMPRYSDAGPQARQDPLRLKNLLDMAEDELRALDAPLREVTEMLEPLRAEIDNAAFWKENGGGLAAFLAPGFQRVYRVEDKLPESVEVDTQFHIRPLLPSLARGGRYYILDLSENHNRLILAEHGTATEIELAAPASLNDSMMLEDREQQLQMHSSGSPQSGMAAGTFHGGGSWNDYEKQEIPLYCKRINDAIVTMLSEDMAPLLVAADERLYASYRAANTYPYLVDKPLFGNYHEVSPQNLAREVWGNVEPFVVREAQDKLARMEDVKNTERGPVDPAHVITAAANGQIDTLFIDPSAQLWGVFDPSTQEVTLHKSRSDGSIDMLELAARETLRSGGIVLTRSANEMPAKTPLAALLRWPSGTSTQRP